MKNILRKLIYKIKNAKLSTKITLIILLVFGGGLTVNHIEQKQEMIKIAKEHKVDMEKDVRSGDDGHRIKSITFEYYSVKHNPMGGFYVNGYVNGNRDLDFQIYFDKNNGKVECAVHHCNSTLAKWKGLE
ncbi:DUF1310 family protein [Ligilactobacillus sp. LYQ135]